MKLDDKGKELIAVGASITANCQPCLQYHVSEAQKAGANEEEIKEAVEVGKMVRSGAASKMNKFASELIRTAAPAKSSQSEGCGCPS